jgi:hypothetical protein
MPESEQKTDKHEREFEYFVDAKRYVTTHQFLTGAQIKAKIPDLNPAFQLVLEGHGHHPDRPIADDERVDLETKHGPLHFILVPPANFGQ